MSLFRPHKQTLVISVVCILGVAIAGYAAYGSPMAKKTIGNPSDTSAIGISPQTEESAPLEAGDWKSQFLSQGSSSIATARKATSSEPDEPYTLTGEFGKKFFQQYMYLKQNNLNEDPAAIKDLVDRATGDFVATAAQARVYDLREMNVTKESGAAAERAYANTIGSILSAYMPRQDAATVALQALETENEAKTKEIVAIASAYDAVLKKILAVPTPIALGTYQTNLVNGISSMSFSSQGMTKVFSDPIQSIVALGTYEKSLEKLRNALLDIKFYFSTNGMQFGANEPASIISIMVQ